jgi:hypothetical protein
LHGTLTGYSCVTKATLMVGNWPPNNTCFVPITMTQSVLFTRAVRVFIFNSSLARDWRHACVNNPDSCCRTTSAFLLTRLSSGDFENILNNAWMHCTPINFAKIHCLQCMTLSDDSHGFMWVCSDFCKVFHSSSHTWLPVAL